MQFRCRTPLASRDEARSFSLLNAVFVMGKVGRRVQTFETHQLMHLYILFKKFKIYIKTLKTLLHVSIPRSSSGSTYCSLLKICIKTISDLLYYINFCDVAACRVFVCASYGVQGETGCGLCNPQPVSLCVVIHSQSHSAS